MDAFDDGFGGEGEVEVDPAAEFLAKEQEELGDIGEWFQQAIQQRLSKFSFLQGRTLDFILLVGKHLKVESQYRLSRKRRYTARNLSIFSFNVMVLKQPLFLHPSSICMHNFQSLLVHKAHR